MSLVFKWIKVLHYPCVLIWGCSTFFLVFALSAQEKEVKSQQKYAGMAIGNDILNSTDRYLTQTTTFWFDWQGEMKMPFYELWRTGTPRASCALSSCSSVE